MSSRSARYMQQLKLNNPDAYERVKEKQRVTSQKKRDELKRKLEEQCLTNAEMEVVESRRIEKNAQALANYWKKKIKIEGQTGESNSYGTPKAHGIKRPRDMNEAEKRAYKAMMRKSLRDRRSSQKKTADKRKRRQQYHKEKEMEAQLSQWQKTQLKAQRQRAQPPRRQKQQNTVRPSKKQNQCNKVQLLQKQKQQRDALAKLLQEASDLNHEEFQKDILPIHSTGLYGEFLKYPKQVVVSLGCP